MLTMLLTVVVVAASVIATALLVHFLRRVRMSTRFMPGTTDVEGFYITVLGPSTPSSSRS